MRKANSSKGEEEAAFLPEMKDNLNLGKKNGQNDTKTKSGSLG
jgi:hypothetical protein